MNTFHDFGLHADILRAVEKLGFETPTEIQIQAIPHLISSDQDLIALAQTGTGKTAAFGLPLLQNISSKERDVQAIVLCPTRELCLQLSKDLESYSAFLDKFNILAVYGGTDISKQIKELSRGIHIVVGTPGRTLDLIKRGKLNLSKIKYVVFDEADEMLSMGFKEDMDAILEVTPAEKQTLLFSATMPPEIAAMTKTYMKNPKEISIGHKNSATKNVEHHYYEVAGRQKYEALKRIVDINPNIYGIVFCRTRAETNDIAERLSQDGYNSDAIHGDLSQNQRDVVMARFRNKQIQLLIATDVAARGIDVDSLTHVINYNLPDEISTYVHRSGRTGRANNEGVSIILLSGKDRNKLRSVEKKIGTSVIKKSIPSGPEVVKAQLHKVIDKIEHVAVDSAELNPFLDEVYERLANYSKEELIQKMLSVEFNRFLVYYKNSSDLNDNSSRGRDRDRDRDRDSDRSDRGDRDDRKSRDRDRGGRDDRGERRKYARFYINLGEKNSVNPQKLLSVINKFTPSESVQVGKIEIMAGFSFFEVEESHAKLISTAFTDAKFGSTDIVVKPVAASKDDSSDGGDRSSSRGNRDRGGRRDGGGSYRGGNSRTSREGSGKKPHRGKSGFTKR